VQQRLVTASPEFIDKGLGNACQLIGRDGYAHWLC
jgi:hypothetical protein